MCFPALLPLAIAAVGAGAKFIGDKQAEMASNQTYAAEHARQEAFTADQTAKFQDSLNKTKELLDPTAQAKAVDTRESGLVSAIAAPQTGGSYLPGSSSAPSVVATAADKATAGSRATSMSLAHAIAAMGGAQDQQLGVDTQIGRNSQAIGQTASFKAGSAGVLDAELKAAAQKGALLRGLGGFAQQIGMSMLTGGAGGGIVPGSAASLPPGISSSGVPFFKNAI